MEKDLKKIAAEIAADTELVEFFKEFVQNRPTLQTEHMYLSEGPKKYQIEYLKYISDYKACVHPTPARIHITENFIQVNKAILDEQKIPDRALLWILFQCIAQNRLNNGKIWHADIVGLYVMQMINMPCEKEVMAHFKQWITFKEQYPSGGSIVSHKYFGLFKGRLQKIKSFASLLQNLKPTIPMLRNFKWYRKLRSGSWYLNRRQFTLLGKPCTVHIWQHKPAGDNTIITDIYVR